MSDTDEAEFWTGIGPAPDLAKLPPGAAQQIAETLGYRYEPAGVDPVAQAAAFDPADGATWAHNLELRSKVRARDAEIEKLRDRLAQVDDLRDEVARLAPGTGPIGFDEMRSIVESARRVAADFPIKDRCGCTAGQTPHDQLVTFHRRGSDQCRAEQ